MSSFVTPYRETLSAAIGCPLVPALVPLAFHRIAALACPGSMVDLLKDEIVAQAGPEVTALEWVLAGPVECSVCLAQGAHHSVALCWEDDYSDNPAERVE